MIHLKQTVLVDGCIIRCNYCSNYNPGQVMRKFAILLAKVDLHSMIELYEDEYAIYEIDKKAFCL